MYKFLTWFFYYYYRFTEVYFSHNGEWVPRSNGTVNFSTNSEKEKQDTKIIKQNNNNNKRTSKIKGLQWEGPHHPAINSSFSVIKFEFKYFSKINNILLCVQVCWHWACWAGAWIRHCVPSDVHRIIITCLKLRSHAPVKSSAVITPIPMLIVKCFTFAFKSTKMT